jgi:hypothetical protein
MMRFLRLSLLLVAVFGFAPAFAEGFAVQDLTQVVPDTSKLSNGEWIDKKEPERLTLACLGCTANPVIDVLLGRQTDGTEDRVRSGETPIARLEQLCQEKQPDCKVTALDVGPAVGWISAWQAGSQSGATAVILRDGDLLTIRSLAETAETAKGNAMALVETLAPVIIGP